MNVFWCRSCDTPIINSDLCLCGEKTNLLSYDLRPVFPEERWVMYNLTHNSNFLNTTVWASKGARYFFNGKSENISLDDLSKHIPSDFSYEKLFNCTEVSNLYNKFNKEVELFIKNNTQHLKNIQFASSNIIMDSVNKYPNSLPVVSFSGGKDSTVVSHLTCTTLSNASVMHLFGDTKLEFPLTYTYMKRFRENNPRTPLLESKSEHDFMDLCDQIGPPSRVMSWCCTVFKTGPLNTLIKNFTKGNSILTFYGIRQSESASRRKYQQLKNDDFMDLHKTSNIDTSPKIHNQRVVSPIFDWHDIEVWLYIFSHDLDLNDSYRLGYTRVGCWCCPNNSRWSTFLTSLYLPEQNSEWENFLINFAKRIGKQDAETYVQTGKWKARQGGAGLVSEQINVHEKPCVDEEHSRTVELTKPISEELYEYMKPFGIINKNMGKRLLDEVYFLDHKNSNPRLKIQGKLGTYDLKVTAINPDNYRLVSQRIDSQIRKYQSCIGCLGCVSVCPQNAIKFTDNKYTISEKDCSGCLECINPWNRGGCLMSKVLSVKKGV